MDINETKKQLYVHTESLYDPVRDIFEVAAAIKRCSENKETLDVVLVTSSDPLASQVKNVIAEKGKQFTYDDLGNLSVLLGYLYQRVDDIRYTTPEQLSSDLSRVKDDMVSQGKTMLYHLCLEENACKFRRLFKKAGFKVYDWYTKLYEGYSFKIQQDRFEDGTLDDGVADVILQLKNGDAYQAPVVTRKFLDAMFKKNRRTGECAKGNYFCMPGMIVVRQITEPVVKATIDDMIENLDVECYFKERN